MISTAADYIKLLGLNSFFYALIGKLTKTETHRLIQVKDIASPIVLRIPSSDFGAFKQIFTHKEYLFKSVIEPKFIIDAGANIGLASIYFANIFPNAKIFSIEPEEKNFSILERNVKPYINITPIKAALWNKVGVISLTDPGLGHWGFMTQQSSGLIENVSESTTAPAIATVPAVTIDSIMSEYKIDNIDILKIDIEGAEKEVFESSESWLVKVNSIIAELHEHMKPGCTRSFYNGTNGFEIEWRRGENIYLSRRAFIAPY